MSTPQGAGRAEPASIAWTISRRLGMVIVLALAFSLSAIVTIYTLFRSGDTRVPNVVGKPEAEAQKLVELAGLRVKIQRREDAAAAGTVIETQPVPNSSVKKDFDVKIVVSSGPAQKKSQLSDPGPALGRRILVRNFIVRTLRGLFASGDVETQ
ncbi:MAG TPA: PASTA domain-containing protein [Blastocatellia bacterium]|nr:PASTA domain-containing protein [Blastocatellia bacterium]